jgi:predicted transglutaminase-like cysteine proteinase
MSRFRRARRLLCAAFATAALAAASAGCGLGGDEPITGGQAYPYGATPLADTFNAFNDAAVQRDAYANIKYDDWATMLQNQQRWSGDAKYVGDYRHFLAEVREFRGEPLGALAQDVNDAVMAAIEYEKDADTYGRADYWATPIETAMNGVGDCEDTAILQYFILRKLGVPEDRLLLAMVGTSPNARTAGVDHAVLLLNTARAGEEPRFLVLNNGAPLDTSQAYAEEGVGNWENPYVLYSAMNRHGYWETQAAVDVYRFGNAPPPARSAAAAPRAAKKMGPA